MSTVGTPAVWGLFALVVVAALAFDLGLFNRKSHEMGMREAGLWVAVWVVLAAAFNRMLSNLATVVKELEQREKNDL